MQLFQSNYAARRAIAIVYVLVAVVGPIMALQFPGRPPLVLNAELAAVADGKFVNNVAALGKGADKYEVDALHDMSNVVASAAADYPDGSNALIAWFDKPVYAKGAIEKFKKMIPHQHKAESDLWTTHFPSDSGEYIMLAATDGLMVLVISEREEMARQRLKSLPVIDYEEHPGLGAVIKQQSSGNNYLLAFAYVALQWLMIRFLFSWAGKARVAEQQASNEGSE